MPPRSLSPLLRFNAKSALADFSKPIEIPHKLDPLEMQNNTKSSDFANNNEFAKRTQAKGWTENANSLIKDIKNSQIRPQKLSAEFYIETEELERMEHLKNLMKDDEDFVFGKDGVLPKGRCVQEVVPEIQMNQIFEQKENIDEVEMYIMGFNEIINVVGKDAQNTADTLKQIRNFFIYKIKEKSKKQLGLEQATKELDLRCYQLQQDSDNLTGELSKINQEMQLLTQKLEKQTDFAEKLKQLNFKMMFEKENLANQNEAISKQNYQLIQEINHQQQEKDDLSNRSRRLQVGISKFRALVEQSHDKIQKGERRIIDLENVIEDSQANYRKLQEQLLAQQQLINSQNAHIAKLQQQISENPSVKLDHAQIPSTAPDMIKQGLQTLIEIAQSASQDLLVKELRIDRTGLLCAENILAAIQNSDFCDQVLEQFSANYEQITQYRTVSIQVDSQDIGQPKKPQVPVKNQRKQLISIDQKPQQQVAKDQLLDEANQKHQEHTQFLLQQIEKLKKDNMQLSQKQKLANMDYLNRSESYRDNSVYNKEEVSEETSKITISEVKEIQDFSQDNKSQQEEILENNENINPDSQIFSGRKKSNSKKNHKQNANQGNVNIVASGQNSIANSSISVSDIELKKKKKKHGSQAQIITQNQINNIILQFKDEQCENLNFGQIVTTDLQEKTAEQLTEIVDYRKQDIKNQGKVSQKLTATNISKPNISNVQQSVRKNTLSKTNNILTTSRKQLNSTNMTKSNSIKTLESNRNHKSNINSNQINSNDNSQISSKTVSRKESPINTGRNMESSRDQSQKDVIQMLSVQQTNILQQVNEIAKTLPADIRSQYKTQLNNVLFKHIDNAINKKNFADFYVDFMSDFNDYKQQNPQDKYPKAPKQLCQMLLNFLTQADTVKTVIKNQQDEKKELLLQKIQFEIPDNMKNVDSSDLKLLNPLEEVTSVQIQEQNIQLQRANVILKAFGVNFGRLALMNDDQFIKHNQELVKRLKVTKQQNLFTPSMASITQNKKKQNIDQSTIDINENLLDDELFPLQSEAVLLENKINALDNYMNEDLQDKVKNFVPPKCTQEIQTMESAIGIDYTMQTDTALEDFINDSVIAKDIKEMFAGNVNDFKVTGLVGMDDDEQALTELRPDQLQSEAGVESSLLSTKVNYNNDLKGMQSTLPQLESVQAVSTKYVENTTIEDGIRDKVKQIESQTERLGILKKEQQQKALIQSMSMLPENQSHFQKGMDNIKSNQIMGLSKMIPSAQQRNKNTLIRAGQISTHQLDQTQVNSKYQIKQSRLIVDQNAAIQRLEAIDKSVPTYQDFLQLVKIQQNKNSSETAYQVLHSTIQIHPRYGEYLRYSQKSIISPPLNDNFVIQHPVDKVYLKYCPADGEVTEFTLFYPVLFQDYNDLEKYYNKINKDDQELGKHQFQNLVTLQKNTLKLFKYQIDVATFKQSYNPSPEIRKLTTFLPQINNTIKYIKLASLTCSTKGYVPLIFKMLEDMTLTKIQFVQIGSYDYIKLPVQNVTVKSLQWTLKLVRTLIVERLSYTQQIFTVSTLDQPSTFVTSADDARKVQFTIIPGQLLRREAESPAAFFVFWALQKYGVKAIVSNLAYNFIINLAYYQYENEEIYLYTRMFFEDLENDYYLLYLEIRRILGFQCKTEVADEFLSTKAIPSVTATILQNWEPKRQYAFVQNVFSILYSKQQNNEFVVPTEISFQQFIQLILFAYGSFRRTAFQQAGLVFNYLAKEQKTDGLLGEGGFRQFAQILLPQWSSKTISEMYFAYSAGLADDTSTDLSLRRMSIQNLQEMFISLQLGRFSQVSSEILDKTVSTELKKLIKNSVFVFQQMQNVSKQIIRILMRHAALQNGEKYLKFSKILKCYVDVIQCDLMAYDFVNSMSNMRLVLSTIIESMLEILPDACIITIGGSMTALKQFLGVIGK